MQLQARKHAAHNRKYRFTVRSISDKVNRKAQKAGAPIRMEIKEWWEKPGYMSNVERKNTIGVASYIAAQVRKRLQVQHNLCAVAVTHTTFLRDMAELLAASTEETIEFVSPHPGNPTTGLVISAVRDGNFFTASERVNRDRQIAARARASHERVQREITHKRLSKAALAALKDDTNKLKTQLTKQLSFTY